MTETRLRLFDYPDSGNGYKARLLLTQLGTPFDFVPIDILKGESRTPEFLSMNPNGRIPLLQISESDFLPESNAILWYLATGSQFLPSEPLLQAQVLQWMFFEQYSHEPNVATPRFWLKHKSPADIDQDILKQKQAAGRDALKVMDAYLADRGFFVADRYGIADIALYAYTHVAEEGGFDMDPYPHINRWCKSIEAQPNYRPLDYWL